MTGTEIKNSFVKTPPMGWNSYDYYDTTVTEEDIKRNARYMAENLKDFGWEYIVVDIQWYAIGAGSQRDRFQYIPFGKVQIDKFGRLIPDETRFPSSKGDAGFKPLADYVHSLGLKFGIHIMRGIPRIAAHNFMPIWGTEGRGSLQKRTVAVENSQYITANEIADPNAICPWNPDMYGVISGVPGAQEYYDSIIQMYADWGVDFIKCDDICRYDAKTAKDEIRMLHKAIIKSGRAIVLSLSPGPAILDEAWYYSQTANMWRITDDFWDDYKAIKNMFDRCEKWQDHVSTGCYPDCDMLPIGMLGKGFGQERSTNFTHDEMITMLSLWCIFKSPLMIGSELTKMDDWTVDLLTNKAVLGLLSIENRARQAYRDADTVVWVQKGAPKETKEEELYVAVFNTSERDIFEIDFKTFMGADLSLDFEATELWSNENVKACEGVIKAKINSHGAKIFRVAKNMM